MIVIAGNVLRTVSIRLLKFLFSVSVCHSLVSFTPVCSMTDPTLLSPFRIAGICAETSRTRAPGKQWVCTLPSANLARMCQTMRLREEISNTGGGGGHRPQPGSLLPLLYPGSVVSLRRSEVHLGRSPPECTWPVQRNTQSRGGGSVSGLLDT